jgi:hypothetical protein
VRVPVVSWRNSAAALELGFEVVDWVAGLGSGVAQGQVSAVLAVGPIAAVVAVGVAVVVVEAAGVLVAGLVKCVLDGS